MCDHMAEYLYSRGDLEIAKTIDMTVPPLGFDDCGYITYNRTNEDEPYETHYYASELFSNASEYLNSWNFKPPLMHDNNVTV